MKQFLKDIFLSMRLWFFTGMALGTGIILLAISLAPEGFPYIIAFTFPATLFASLPALVILSLSIRFIGRSGGSIRERLQKLALLCFGIASCYGFLVNLLLAGEFLPDTPSLYLALLYTAAIFSCTLLAIAASWKRIREYFRQFDPPTDPYSAHFKNQPYMSTEITEKPAKPNSDKLLIKGLVTGVLILLMLIPTFFVSNLVKEREERQKEVVQEVSSKWSSSQRLSGPYISVPYVEHYTGNDGKTITTRKNLVFLPENLVVNGTIIPQERPRSIYKVLLYKTDIHSNGHFNVSLPEDIIPGNIIYNKARICIGLSDYKGIEERISIRFNNNTYNLVPGLPTTELDEVGLSAPIAFSVEDLAKPLAFNTNLKFKGSSNLRFLPLSANSKFQLRSTWADPSFDGFTLPSTREVKDSGFVATWSFNQANLPFGTVNKDGAIKAAASSSFGVNMLQPADQYAKTLRSVKYAILFIGLTFALFFIIEVMQQRPVHPVQYILVGIALVIFYTLLLSISEFIAFDTAYIIAAAATVLLITLYAKGHFKSWKIASLFAGVLSCLYGFIFILIRLEDTALLVGSIGLFIVLALVMYASRNVNWYGTQPKPSL